MDKRLVLFVIDLADRARLTDIFGRDATERALTDVGDGVDPLITRLLAQHQVVARTREDLNGRWTAHFRISNSDTLRDPQETLSSIETAGCWLLRELLYSVFGSATGMRISARLMVLSLPPHVAESSMDDAWLADRLASVPYLSMRQDQAQSSSEIDSILAGNSIRTFLQPIVRMADRKLLGYEALSRGPLGAALEQPDRLFNAAHAIGRSKEIELLCAKLALERTLGKIPPGCFLTINLGVEALQDATECLALAGRSDVVFELTEHLPLNQAAGLAEAIDKLKRLGVGIALDDTGCGFADLDTARMLRPDIVKLCITIIRNADKGQPYMAAIRQTVEQLRALGARVLAEGVETEEQHAALSDCDIELAQGWLYGKPFFLDPQQRL